MASRNNTSSSTSVRLLARKAVQRARRLEQIWLTVLLETMPKPASAIKLSMSRSDSPRTYAPMTSASNGRVRTADLVSGMIWLTKGSAVLRSCGMAISSSPSAV